MNREDLRRAAAAGKPPALKAMTQE